MSPRGANADRDICPPLTKAPLADHLARRACGRLEASWPRRGTAKAQVRMIRDRVRDRMRDRSRLSATATRSHRPTKPTTFADWDICPPPWRRREGTHVPPPYKRSRGATDWPPNRSSAVGKRLPVAPRCALRVGGKRDRSGGDARPVAL